MQKIVKIISKIIMWLPRNLENSIMWRMFKLNYWICDVMYHHYRKKEDIIATTKYMRMQRKCIDDYVKYRKYRA